MKVEDQIKSFVAIYEQLRKKYRWRANNQSLIMIAGQLAAHEKPFQLNEFIRLVDFIKDESSAFSYVQSTDLRFMLAGLLWAEYEDPQSAYPDMMQIYEKLIEGGFKRSPHAYIAAYALFSSLKDGDDADEHVERSINMYKGIKEKHFFLTSHEDYPLSVLLAEEEGEQEELLDDMSYYYDQLHIVLAKGNNRQFLSQILTYGRQDNRQLLVQNTVTWLDDLRQNKMKLRGNHLPVVGVLALAGRPSDLLPEVKDVFENLVSHKQFKWHRDLCFMVAVRFVVQKQAEENRFLDVGLATTIESILQAQQAATFAAISASAAAAASSSSD
ncbi:DUF4003 family protein [Jeotgalibacillus sp. R-1-5s-1]|uniref:DUF4003 family protein n=1 Tax=Jeotgalibacillus sp. R-1-5s-1 TaxID=2555897 RepID=UPI001069F406|nr:DUF4003 family protein [Jeotgalibacillus sp. R-1-5s-1]TFD98408.1 DUF4003 family protein [Jeotgalibacillus sp. R-1-5s-1]